MGNFKLLLKNSFKSMQKSIGLVTQFTILTTVATITVSSVSLSNFSLNNTMKNVQSKSNLNGFSIESTSVDNFANYNIIVESNNLSKSLEQLSFDDTKGWTKIYNPLNNYQENKKILTVNNEQYETYGFFELYDNIGYDTYQDSINWNNIIFSNKGESLPIITKLIDQKYSKQIADVFSLYSKILPPSPNEVKESNYQIFYDPSIYSFDPWSLTTKADNTLVVNHFGAAKVKGLEYEYTTDILYNHGIFDKEYSFIVGTNNSFLDEEYMQDNLKQMQTISNDIKMANQEHNAFSNNWQQPSKTIDINSRQELIDLTWKWYKSFGNNYHLFLNTLHKKISNNFMVNSKYFTFNYLINTDNSKGIAKFFSDIFVNPNNKFHYLANDIFDENDKILLKGSIDVPLIPFITTLPKLNKNEIWDFEQYKDWTNNGFLDSSKSELNINGIQAILNNTLGKLSSRLINSLTSKLDSNILISDIKKEYFLNYDLEYFLKNSMNLEFSKSSNFNINDFGSNTYIINSNNYFNYKNKVNNLFIENGINYFANKITKDYLNFPRGITDQYGLWFNTASDASPDWQKQEFFKNDKYFFIYINILRQIKINLNDEFVHEFYKLVNNVSNIDLFQNNFSLWKTNLINLLRIYRCSSFTWNGAGYNFEFTKKNSLGVNVDFSGYYYEPSSFTSVISMNYAPLKNGSKNIIDQKFIERAISLPFKTKKITESDIINNFIDYKKHIIYNPYSQKYEFYNDFYEWMSRLDKKYKIDINGDEFVIVGTGVTSEFTYPILSSSQLLINNKEPVVFVNELGYDKLLKNNTISDISNYFINYNSSDFNYNNFLLNKVNQWTNRVYGKTLAYNINDPNQPNKLLYQRINFPFTILKIVFSITMLIAMIIVLLSLIFMYVLMKSIINQNMNTFAIGIANGISKRKLLFSFLPFVLIPSSISALLGYGFSFLTYPIISNAIQDYWILDYIKFNFNFGYLIFAFLLVTLIIFAVQSIVIYVLLNQNVTVLLNKKFEFKSNSMVQSMHKMVTKLKPLTSFRLTYMLGNFGRLILLLLMMTSFVSLTTIATSTLNTFTTAVQKTADNKLYNYAIDYITPSEQGGYYYDIPYKLLGSRQKGLTPLYNLNKTEGFYTKKYKEALTYNIPGTNESVTYENIFLPSSEIIGDVQGHITFFRNKILYLPVMDFGINFVGNYINPWEWSKKIFPTSILQMIQEYMQVQMTLAFLYVLSIAWDFNNPDRDIWISDKSDKLGFIKSFNNHFTEPEYWDQTNWLMQLEWNKSSRKYIWRSNQYLITDGLPNYTITVPFVNFMTRLISFNQNPGYKQFVRKISNSLFKQELNFDIDTSFMLGLNVVPVDPELDETYTYLETTSFNFQDREDRWFKIYGIKPDSKQMVLWDEYNNIDLKTLLQTYTIENNVYPLIINEVVQKKYGINVNDIIKVRVNNKYKRYTNTVNNVYNTDKYSFKVLGVTTSKSEEQYYTTQEVANKLIGFEKPKLATLNDLQTKNYEYKWVNQKEIDDYVPFNGVFSKQLLPKMLGNFATLYSKSGLSPMSGSLPTSGLGDTFRQIQKNYAEINKVLRCNFVDESKSRDLNTIKEFNNRYEYVFGTDKYYESAIYKIDTTFSTSLLGNVIDSTVKNVNMVAIMSLLPAILIIIVLMSYMIVVESRRLVALLKVLGFSNWSNTITLSTVQFVVTGIAILLGYGISAIILSLLKTFAFSAFSIIVAPIIPGWTAAVTLGTLLIIISTITLTIYLNLRKSNPAQEIAMR